MLSPTDADQNLSSFRYLVQCRKCLIMSGTSLEKDTSRGSLLIDEHVAIGSKFLASEECLPERTCHRVEGLVDLVDQAWNTGHLPESLMVS